MAYRTRSSYRRLFGALLAALLTASFVTAETPPTHAQGFGWFGGILGGGTPERSPSSPSYPGYRSRDGYFGGSPDDGYRRPRGDSDDRAQRRRAQRRKRPAEPAQDSASAAPKSAPSKANATIFVDVFGDTFGQLLANGLDEALADRTDVAIVRKARGPSGLVNTSYFDWPKAINDLPKPEKGKSDKKTETAGDKKGGDKTKGDKAKQDAGKGDAAKTEPTKTETAKTDRADDKKGERIDVAIMMIGSNDRQPITVDGKTYQRGSDEWNAIYHRRVMAIAEAFQRRKIPLIWVGLPIVKDDEFADDLAAFNEIYKDAALKTGATYVDSWEVFSDDKGDFNAFGPDINGQTVRLRTTEGIFFTYAGGRKLAHFVETHLRRDIDGKAPPQLPTATADAPTGGKKVGDTDKPGHDRPGEKKGKAPSVAMVKPEAGPIKNLGELPRAKDGLLMQIPAASTEANVVTTAGKTEVVPANRADNFRWQEPPKPDAKPAAPAPR